MYLLYTEWLYCRLLSESSNYKLGRLDIENLPRTHSLTHAPTPLLEPLAVQAPPGLKTGQGQVNYEQVKSLKNRSSQVKPGQVLSKQVKSVQVRPKQVKVGQVK